MFTGIIETTGMITGLEIIGSNHSFWIESALSPSLRVDQSVSHSGVCLTVESINEGRHKVTAIAETLAKTNLENWQVGSLVNIERCLPVNGRLDGHLVQGHVDTTASCVLAEETAGSWKFTFQYPKEFAHLVIEKGSICLNGVSLTVFDISETTFSVAIIPYTFSETNMHLVKPGDRVNVEFDIIGKYLARWRSLENNNSKA